MNQKFDYFSPESFLNPFLHTSLEEQFYFVWPALLLLCGKRFMPLLPARGNLELEQSSVKNVNFGLTSGTSPAIKRELRRRSAPITSSGSSSPARAAQGIDQ